MTTYFEDVEGEYFISHCKYISETFIDQAKNILSIVLLDEKTLISTKRLLRNVVLLSILDYT